MYKERFRGDIYNMELFTPETLRTLIIIVSGAFIGSISTVLVSLINKRSEERKHYREIVIKTAVENYKVHVDICKYNKQETEQDPLDSYILHMMILFDTLSFRKMTRKKVMKGIEKYHGIYSEARKRIVEIAKAGEIKRTAKNKHEDRLH